jgi:hypothetical protein
MITCRSALLTQYAISYENASSTFVPKSYDRPALSRNNSLFRNGFSVPYVDRRES